MNWYTHIYTYASYASPWAPNIMKSGLKDLFPHLVGVFNIGALSKNPSYLPVMFLGWRYRKPPSSWAYCSGYLMLPPDISMKQWNKWVWVNTYRYIFSGMNIHLPAILGFTRYQGFDPSPSQKHSAGWDGTCQDIDWPGYVSWIFECEIRFLPWDPLGDPDPTAPVRDLMLHLLGQNHV